MLHARPCWPSSVYLYRAEDKQMVIHSWIVAAIAYPRFTINSIQSRQNLELIEPKTNKITKMQDRDIGMRRTSQVSRMHEYFIAENPMILYTVFQSHTALVTYNCTINPKMLL